MKNYILLLCFSILFNLATQAKINEFYNFGASVNLSMMDNFAYGASTNPNKLFIGGGLNYGFSLNEEFNLLVGLDFQSVAPNNARSDYEICDGSPSCLPESKSSQLYIPIGFEYYSNTNRSRFQSFYNVNLIPAFSVTENINITPYNTEHIAQASYKVSDNGFKFQNLFLSIGVNNEFGFNEKIKVFIEPSMRYSLLFKREDVVNPNYMIMVKIGFKYRGVKK
jgi:hypothetical protein